MKIIESSKAVAGQRFDDARRHQLAECRTAGYEAWDARAPGRPPARSQSAPHRQAYRARVLLMPTDGIANTWIAEGRCDAGYRVVLAGSVHSGGLAKLGEVRKGRCEAVHPDRGSEVPRPKVSAK